MINPFPPSSCASFTAWLLAVCSFTAFGDPVNVQPATPVRSDLTLLQCGNFRPEDTVLLTSDHGFIEMLSPDAALVPDAEAQAAARVPQEDIYTASYRGWY